MSGGLLPASVPAITSYSPAGNGDCAFLFGGVRSVTVSTPQPAPLSVACPSCAAKLRVPAELAGKTVKCKTCGTAFKVAPPTARPATVRPARAAPAAPPPPPADAPIGFADDEDDAAGGQYGVQKDDLDIPRCPRCAKELDPPDTKICLSCGFDLLARKRHESRVVYELTFADYFWHLMPGILCVLAAGLLIAGMTVCGLKMRDWLTGSFLDTDEKDPTTLKSKFYVPPFCFNTWIFVFGIYGTWKAGKFAIKRLFVNWRPPERQKRE